MKKKIFTSEEWNEHFNQEHDKAKARHRLPYHLRTGNIQKKPCEVCGSVENLEAHHDDYSAPLQVRWLCRRHHKQLHKELRVASEMATRT